MNIIQYFHS